SVPPKSAPQRHLAGPSFISLALPHRTPRPTILTLFPLDWRFAALRRFGKVARSADFCLSHTPFTAGGASRRDRTAPGSLHRSSSYARTAATRPALTCLSPWQSPCGWALHPDDIDALVAYGAGLRQEDRNDEAGPRCLDGAA